MMIPIIMAATRTLPRPKCNNIKATNATVSGEHRENVWLLALATLVVVVGVSFMTFHIPGGAGLIGTVFGALAGKELINSGSRNRQT